MERLDGHIWCPSSLSYSTGAIDPCHMPRGDLLDDSSCHRFVGNFAFGTLADRTLFGLLACHRDQLADLFSGDLAPPSRARKITESVLH